MDNCINCKVICNNAGKDGVPCKKFAPVKTLIIETDEYQGFPKRIVVKSSDTGNEKVFVQI